MAELVLFIGDQPSPAGYKDGDICDCFNDRRILCCHAEMICHVKHCPCNHDGLRESGSLADMFQGLTYQYRFDRVSQYEVKRADLKEGTSEVFEKPDIDVPLFIKRRLQHKQHRIFGSMGREYWYGGRTDSSMSVIDVVWREIENRTSARIDNHKDWPLSSNELRKYLVVPVDDFDDDIANELTAPLDIAINPSDICRRKHRVSWENLQDISGRTIENVRNQDVVVKKPRSISYPISVIDTKKIAQ